MDRSNTEAHRSQGNTAAIQEVLQIVRELDTKSSPTAAEQINFLRKFIANVNKFNPISGLGIKAMSEHVSDLVRGNFVSAGAEVPYGNPRIIRAVQLVATYPDHQIGLYTRGKGDIPISYTGLFLYLGEDGRIVAIKTGSTIFCGEIELATSVSVETATDDLLCEYIVAEHGSTGNKYLVTNAIKGLIYLLRTAGNKAQEKANRIQFGLTAIEMLSEGFDRCMTQKPAAPLDAYSLGGSVLEEPS